MKDFLRVPLSDGAVQAPPAVAERLDWGPNWRFDHTMVLAPRVRVRSGGGESERVLVDAPVVFGGGGGMDIFSDIWVFDMAANEWIEVPTLRNKPHAEHLVHPLLPPATGAAGTGGQRVEHHHVNALRHRRLCSVHQLRLVQALPPASRPHILHPRHQVHLRYRLRLPAQDRIGPP